MSQNADLKLSFSRKEAIELTRSTSNQLQSLERSKLIIPKRSIFSGQAKPHYNLNQLVAVLTYQTGKGIGESKLRTAIDQTEKRNLKTDLDKHLVLINNYPIWTLNWDDFAEQVPSYIKRGSTQDPSEYAFTVFPTLRTLIDELLENAKKRIDFGEAQLKIEAALSDRKEPQLCD